MTDITEHKYTAEEANLAATSQAKTASLISEQGSKLAELRECASKQMDILQQRHALIDFRKNSKEQAND